MSTTGEEVAPLKYDGVEYGFKDGLCIVQLGLEVYVGGDWAKPKYGYANTEDVEVIPPKCDIIEVCPFFPTSTIAPFLGLKTP
ncbi:MAG: WG repeat-containing protein [Holophagaceae bacterium]